mmetsp:Transcript_12205/g.32127  ORF Transcript_12205/g.32127 Transcript_12205/m.32127 type:complete len:93 (+) Transcript_12205:239-517(+)
MLPLLLAHRPHLWRIRSKVLMHSKVHMHSKMLTHSKVHMHSKVHLVALRTPQLQVQVLSVMLQLQAVSSACREEQRQNRHLQVSKKSNRALE